MGIAFVKGKNMKYDVMIIGAGPGGIFSAYELINQDSSLKIAVFEYGNPLEKRHCPIDGDKIKSCINCKSCGIMNGLPMSLEVLCMNISERKKPLNL